MHGYNVNGGGVVGHDYDDDDDDDSHNIFTLLNLQSTRHGRDIKMVTHKHTHTHTHTHTNTHTHTHTHTHTPKAVCECVDVNVFWNKAVHTDR